MTMRKSARRTVAVVIGVVAALFAVAAMPAMADSPHFLFANASVSSTTGALTVNFKDAGLGTGTTSVAITLHVNTASATYQCFNNGGNHPKAGNKETVSHSLTVTGNFPVRNGSTTGSLSTGPPDPGGFTCPSGQTLFLVGTVTYSGITVSDASGNTAGATPDPASANVGFPPSGGIRIG
jgi:hypothetical protein